MDGWTNEKYMNKRIDKQTNGDINRKINEHWDYKVKIFGQRTRGLAGGHEENRNMRKRRKSWTVGQEDA